MSSESNMPEICPICLDSRSWEEDDDHDKRSNADGVSSSSAANAFHYAGTRPALFSIVDTYDDDNKVSTGEGISSSNTPSIILDALIKTSNVVVIIWDYSFRSIDFISEHQNGIIIVIITVLIAASFSHCSYYCNSENIIVIK